VGGKGLGGFRILQNRGGHMFIGYHRPPHPLYQTEDIPLPGVIWVVILRELGEPGDVRLTMSEWVERNRCKIVCFGRYSYASFWVAIAKFSWVDFFCISCLWVKPFRPFCFLIIFRLNQDRFGQICIGQVSSGKICFSQICLSQVCIS
jgi:hypothetical protein